MGRVKALRGDGAQEQTETGRERGGGGRGVALAREREGQGRGCSFDDLLKNDSDPQNPTLYGSFQEAAIKKGLLKDEEEWSQCP